MKYTDPSGHFFFAVVAAIVVGVVASVAVAAIQGGNIGTAALTGAISGFLGVALPFGTGIFASAAINSMITGGDIGSAMIGASIGFGIGFATSGLTSGLLEQGLSGAIASSAVSVVVGALSGGFGSLAAGGDFATGAMYGAIGASIAVGINMIGYGAKSIAANSRNSLAKAKLRYESGTPESKVGETLMAKGSNAEMMTDTGQGGINYAGGGSKELWDNYRKAYIELSKSAHGKEMINYLENSSKGVNIVPTKGGNLVIGNTFYVNSNATHQTLAHEFHHLITHLSGDPDLIVKVSFPEETRYFGAGSSQVAERQAVRAQNIVHREWLFATGKSGAAAYPGIKFYIYPWGERLSVPHPFGPDG